MSSPRDWSNNQTVNVVVHNAASDSGRGLPAVGKIVWRTDSTTLEVCTSTSPNATIAGGGTWSTVGP